MNLKMTDEMIEMMKLQRTGAVGKRHPVRLFQKNLEEDFEMIKLYLPEDIHSVLDIGCGLGGIDLMIKQAYPLVNLWLLDKNEVDPEIHYGYKSDTSAYNKLEMTRDFLALNGIERRDIKMFEARDADRLPDHQFELVISLISCGFHYPVDMYLGTIMRTLAYHECVLILDIRKHSDQEETLQKKFNIVEPIREFPKHVRYCCRENK